MYGRQERFIQGFGGGTRQKLPLRRPRHRWEDNIKMDLQELVWGSMDWLGLVHNRERWQAFVNAIMNLQFP
jgi:hypothetical protein